MVGTIFEFATANTILFGSGRLSEIGKISAGHGKKALLVLGVENINSDRLKDILDASHVKGFQFMVDKEPSIEVVQDACSFARKNACDLVIGFGGGSAIDTAKSVAALLTNPGRVYDYLEVVGKGKPIQNQPLPVIAIPTTAGTGAEVTRNAVLFSSSHQVKVSLRSPLMLPRLALIDPELTLDLPAPITASTGLDALTQVIEPFVSNQANPLTDSFCREGITRAARSLRKVFFKGEDLEARQDMCLVSLFGGLALANSKLGAVHGFAGVIGGMFSGPHGAICARLLPQVITMNVLALKERDPAGDYLRRFDEIGKLLTGNPNADASDAVRWIDSLVDELDVPPLSTYGMDQDDIPEIVEKSSKASSMKGNPVQLSFTELSLILQKAL